MEGYSKNKLIDSLTAIQNIYVLDMKYCLQIKFQNTEIGTLYFSKDDKLVLYKNNENFHFDNLENLIDFLKYFNNFPSLNYII